MNFGFFGIEYIPLELLNKIRGKSVTHNIFRIPDNESVMCEFCCIAFIGHVLVGNTLLDHTNLFSPNDYKKNDKIIYKYLKINMVEEASLEFGLRKIDETRNYLLDEIKHNYLISEKYIKTSNYLNCVGDLLILTSTGTGFNFCVCFISYYSCRYYQFCSRNKYFCNHCRN